MIELSRHIERLLLDNDCVIVPGLGGFVSYAVAARRVSDENLFLPPMRTIGFNSRLTLNDGLLIQSYMQSYDCSYPEASRIVEAAVEEVLDTLENAGSVEFEGIGVLNLSIDHVYTFNPNESGILSPSLYGLSSFGIKQLSDLPEPIVSVEKPLVSSVTPLEEKLEIPAKEDPKDVKQAKPDKHHYVIRINRKIARYVSAAAASVALFFTLSTPVQNTYVEEENYASLSNTSLFNQIRTQSAAFNILNDSEKAQEEMSIIAEKPADKAMATPSQVAVAEEPAVAPEPVQAEEVKEAEKAEPIAKPEKTVIKAEPAIKAEPEVKIETPKKQTNRYKVIVSSFPSRSEAEKAVSRLISDGYSTAFVIEGDGRCRIAIAAFATSAEAYRKTNELRQSQAFADAWVLTTK